MSGWRLPALIGAVAAGVLLPKVVPAALLGKQVGGRTERFLALLPTALLAALAAASTLGGEGGPRPRPAVAAGVAVAVLVAAVTRRGLVAMACGWAALAAALLVG